MRSSWTLALVLVVACGDSGLRTDGGMDAAIDVPMPPDAAYDAAIDAQVPPDAAIDAAVDAPTPPDAPAPPDAAIDAAIDAPPAAGHLEVSAPVFGTVLKLNSTRRLAHVVNTGGSTVSFSPAITAGTSDYSIEPVGTTCSGTLDPGDACDINVTVRPLVLGVRTGTLALGDPDATSVPLIATSAYLIELDVGGAGTGVITSDPAGIDCGATCSGLFTTAVTLTAVPDGDAVWTGWSGSTLVVDPPTSNFVAISGDWNVFATLAFAAGGDQPFELFSEGDKGDEIFCAGPCTVTVPAGEQFQLFATTPAVFGGFSGACTSTTRECDFTANADDTITVTATAGQHIARAYHTVDGLQSGDVLAGGDFVVGANTAVKRIAASTGAVLWSVPSVSRASVVATPDGHVAALGNHVLAYLDAGTGSIVWSRAAVAPFGNFGTHEQLAVSPVDGSIAVFDNGRTQVTVLDPSGAVTFVVPVVPDGIVYTPDGTLHVFTVEDPTADSTRVDELTFASDGTQLAGPTIVEQHDQGGEETFAFDSTGGLVSSHSNSLDVDLTVGLHDVTNHNFFDDHDPDLVAVSPDDHVWWARPSVSSLDGYTIELYTHDLVNELSVDRGQEFDPTEDVQLRQLRALPDGGVVMFAEYKSALVSIRGAILVFER